MNEYFELFEKGIRLNTAQKDDVAKKFKGVGNSLYREFYGEGEDKTKRFKIGSHGKKTELRDENGDLDMIFKITQETLERYKAHEYNGPSELLRRAKEGLQKTYSNSSTEHKSWGKVVLVKFAGYDVEVMPCYEEDDGTFTIPNSEDNGSWDLFDPRSEINNVKRSNDETGCTRRFIRMSKHWNNRTGKTIKSYMIENLCVAFMDDVFSSQDWSELFEGFFKWIPFQVDSVLSDDALSRVATASSRVIKARDYEINDDIDKSCEQWRLVFGNEFPIYDEDLDVVTSLEKQFPSEVEEWIEERYPVRIDSDIQLEIESHVKPHGWRSFVTMSSFLAMPGNSKLLKSSNVEFSAKSKFGNTINYRWKIRNLSEEAQKDGKLRGTIEPPGRDQSKYKDSTAYQGIHYIECYAIKDGVCIAKKRLLVPIGYK